MQNHPLFTLESDLNDDEQRKEAEIDIGYINVQRLVNGHYVNAGRLFEASEIDSLQRFIAEFGGGKFKLYGRGPDNKGVVRQVTIAIDENQYPPRYAPVAGQPALGSLPNPSATPASPAGGQMFGMPLQEFATIMQLLKPAPAPDNSGVLAAIVNSQAQITTAIMGMMSQLSTASSSNLVELAKAMQQQPNGGNNPAAIQDSFMRGIQAMAQIAKDMKEGDGGGGLTWEHLVTMFEKGAEAFGSAKSIIQTVNASADASPGAGAAIASAAELGQTVPAAA